MEETEGVAVEITQELQRNREKIESAHSKVNFILFWYYASLSFFVCNVTGARFQWYDGFSPQNIGLYGTTRCTTEIHHGIYRRYPYHCDCSGYLLHYKEVIDGNGIHIQNFDNK